MNTNHRRDHGWQLKDFRTRAVSEAGVSAPHPDAMSSIAMRFSTSTFSRLFWTQFAIWTALLAGLRMTGAWGNHEPERISIDYPLNKSVFPPDMEGSYILVARLSLDR